MLRCLKLGQYKVRAEELDRFLREAEGFDITDPEDVVPLDSGVSPKRMRHPQRSAADKRGCALIRPDKSIAKESL